MAWTAVTQSVTESAQTVERLIMFHFPAAGFGGPSPIVPPARLRHHMRMKRRYTAARAALRRGATMALCAVLVGGCVRAGFEPAASSADGRPFADAPHGAADGARDQGRDRSVRDGAHRPEAGLPPSEAGPILTLNAAHEDCASALVVDWATLPKPITIQVDMSQADADLNLACCKLTNLPDLVFKVVNATGSIKVTCAGGGQWIAVSDLTCPTNATSCFSGTCASSSSFTTAAAGLPRYFALCRSPGAGTALLTLSP